MSFTSSAPARQPVPELPEHNIPGRPEPQKPPKSGENRVVFFRLLWEHRRHLCRVALCGLLASLLLAFLIPARYQSTAQLMPPDGQAGSGTAMRAALGGALGGPALGGLAGDLLGAKNTGALFVGILGSRTVEDRLIEKFDLRRVYWASKMEDARKELSQQTAVSEERKSGIITIKVTDHDPRRAAAMAQAYVTELDRLVAEVSTSSARRERIFLEERLRDVKNDLDGAAQKFSEFASKNTAIDIPAQGKAMVEAAATLQGQLIAAESELRGLEQIYTSSNVRVRSLQARVAELRQQLQKLGGSDSMADVRNDNSLYPSIRKLPLLGVTYSDLYRQTKIQETVYELLTQEYELAKVQEAKEIPSVKVLDAAVVPTKKSFPPRLLVLFSGTSIALAGGVTWVVGRSLWQAADPADPGKVLAQEVFATVQARLPRFSQNGSQSVVGKLWGRYRRPESSGQQE